MTSPSGNHFEGSFGVPVNGLVIIFFQSRQLLLFYTALRVTGEGGEIRLVFYPPSSPPETDPGSASP